MLDVNFQRHVKIDEKMAKDKKQLVELFKRVAMPLSQRSCFQKKVCSPVKMDIDPPHNNRYQQHVNYPLNSYFMC